MNPTMTVQEPINYLDSILNEEETRCQYNHQWRNLTISRSGRFKSKNRKRDVIDGKLFADNNGGGSSVGGSSSGGDSAGVNKYKEQDKNAHRYYGSSSGAAPSFNGNSKSPHPYQQQQQHYQQQLPKAATAGAASAYARDKTDSYKSYYETNL